MVQGPPVRIIRGVGSLALPLVREGVVPCGLKPLLGWARHLHNAPQPLDNHVLPRFCGSGGFAGAPHLVALARAR